MNFASFPVEGREGATNFTIEREGEADAGSNARRLERTQARLGNFGFDAGWSVPDRFGGGEMAWRQSRRGHQQAAVAGVSRLDVAGHPEMAFAQAAPLEENAVQACHQDPPLPPVRLPVQQRRPRKPPVRQLPLR